MNENLTGWRALLPYLALSILIFDGSLAEVLATLIESVAGAR